MRRLWIGFFAVLLVALALGIGIYIGLMLNRQPSEGNFSPTPTPSPIPTASLQPTQTIPTPTPSPTAPATPGPQTITITDHNIEVAYSEYSRQTNEGTTKIVLLLEAQYQGEEVTLSYDNFRLSILTSRGGLEPYPIYLETGKVAPAESGSVTVGGVTRRQVLG
jgi:hypothetical protein